MTLTIETPRLRLRPMSDDDMEPFLAMATDAEAMRYVSPEPISREQAELWATHCSELLATNGYGMKLEEVVALTTAGNIPSQRVMQRLGMTHDPLDDFDHPLLVGSPLQRCVLYRIASADHC